MGYLFLSIALVLSKVKGFCSKKLSGFTSRGEHILIVSLLRMTVCALFGAVFVVVLCGVEFRVDNLTLLIAFVNGLSTVVFVYTWMLCVRTGAYTMIDLFLTLGIVVPLSLCSVFFKERVSFIKWVGVGVLVVATAVMCSYSKEIKIKQGAKGYLSLAVCGLANGTAQFTQKWFALQTVGKQMQVPIFNFYSYVFATLILFLVLLVFGLKKRENVLNGLKNTKILKRGLVYVVVMAISLFLHSYFTTRSAQYLSTTELYPLQQGIGLILSVIMARIFFNERINVKCIIGVLITLVALFIINVLPSIL